MNQIYYTQCPIGYGLGASNGFQIKRLSPGYVLSGDFRHLGLRAFLAGTRTMAPPALRYRRGEGGVAEVAWLTPRSHEYETERGPWGRPGGHFAHGLQLDDAELRALSDWPAGLFDRPLWTRSDREPSRGQSPEPLELSATDLRLPPTFEAVGPLVAGEDVERLARLLTALATMTREDRTLYLIDAPERLADRVALLTFAFPEPYRAALTFSTFHDRPEELPGFRLQGTIPGARPNRLALLSQGIVADLAAGTIEPDIAPERWALTLAGWLVHRTGDDCRAWEATNRRARLARAPESPRAIWSPEWLDRLFAFQGQVDATLPVPQEPSGWTDLAETAHWARDVGQAEEWSRARGPSWWKSAAAEATEARQALLAHIGLPESWRGDGEADAWGEAVARWVALAPPTDRTAMLAPALRAAPREVRARFVRALIKTLPAALAEETLGWLKKRPDSDRELILPLEVRPAAEAAIERREPRPLRGVLARALELPAALTAVLDALAAEADDRPKGRDVLTGLLAETLEAAEPAVAADVRRWALRQGDAADAWIGRPLRRAFANPMNLDVWRDVLARTPPELRRSLARVVLRVAADRTLPDEPFRWGVEEVLLPIAESERPHDPSWPGQYLDRMPSGLNLLTRLFSKEYRTLGVRRWLDRARAEGEISPEQVARLVGCERYAQALRSGDARKLLNVQLPTVPADERGLLLSQALAYLGGASDETLDLALDSCRDAWPGAFEPRAVGLGGLARVIAEALIPFQSSPNLWFNRLVHVLDRLALTAPAGSGFEPDGLAAEVVAATTRRLEPEYDPWRLRQFLFQNDAAWRILALDIVRELHGTSPGDALKVLARWDGALAKGLHSARFFELWLNACDGRVLAAVVATRSADLKTFGALPWWASSRFPGARDDLRDAFARLAPMAPIANETLVEVAKWIRPTRRVSRPSGPVVDPAATDLVPLDMPSPRRRETVEPDWSGVSELGRARWQCLEALAGFDRTGIEAMGRWKDLLDRRDKLGLEQLDLDDRYRFVAWLIKLTNELDDVFIPKLASWLFKAGMTDADRIKSRWGSELEEWVDAASDFNPARMKMVYELCEELKKVIKDWEGR